MRCCQRLGCPNLLPDHYRTDARYCSPTCSREDRRARSLTTDGTASRGFWDRYAHIHRRRRGRSALSLATLAVTALAFAGCGGTRHATVDHCQQKASTSMACVAHHLPRATLYGPPTTPKVGARYGTGIDFAWACPNPSGWAFGVSYLSNDSSKDWSRGCLSWWHGAHKGTASVFETTAGRALSGYYAGRSDAQYALARARALGIPLSRPIYFAVDVDTSGNGYSIVPYFRGVVSVLGVHRTGVYGGLTSVNTIHAYRLAAFYWQTSAWSGGSWASFNNLEQYAYPNNTYDLDRALTADYGQWPIAGPKPKPDPYRIYSRRVYRFGRDHAVERNTVVAYDRNTCRGVRPLKRVCQTTDRHLRLLLGRLDFVAHHALRHGHWVSVRPNYRIAHRGLRRAGISRRLQKG